METLAHYELQIVKGGSCLIGEGKASMVGTVFLGTGFFTLFNINMGKLNNDINNNAFTVGLIGATLFITTGFVLFCIGINDTIHEKECRYL